MFMKRIVLYIPRKCELSSTIAVSFELQLYGDQRLAMAQKLKL